LETLASGRCTAFMALLYRSGFQKQKLELPFLSGLCYTHHNGFGRKLVDHVFSRAQDSGIKKITFFPQFKNV
jgi:hypothetical protein